MDSIDHKQTPGHSVISPLLQEHGVNWWPTGGWVGVTDFTTVLLLQDFCTCSGESAVFQVRTNIAFIWRSVGCDIWALLPCILFSPFS